MQLMLATGKEQKVGDITKLEPNIHAGVEYMRFVRTSSSKISRWTIWARTTKYPRTLATGNSVANVIET